VLTALIYVGVPLSSKDRQNRDNHAAIWFTDHL
jgi:hypothetical protein